MLHDVRTLIAEAVHDAVCTFSRSDGFRLCQLYTVAGYMLLSHIDGPKWVMQAGSAWMLADPPDGWWYYDAGTPYALERGEFHCWLAKQGATKDSPPAAFVDFSSRHFHRMIDQMLVVGGGERIPWTHTTEPPPFIWTEGTQSDWVHWEPQPALCQALWTSTLAHIEAYRPLIRLVAERYKARVRAYRHTAPI
jgi:hypothetical protein